MIESMYVMKNLSPRHVGRSAMVVSLVAMSLSPAVAAVGAWQGEGSAKVRLIAAGVGADGRIAAGIEIALEPGWKTYWRTPGDAGVAPLIDFSASTNIDDVVIVEFPVPSRYDDGYAVTNVYKDTVVLPVTVTPNDPQATTELVLSLDIGVCAEICIPEHYDLTLDLAPDETDATVDAILAGARASLPGAPRPGVLEVGRIERAGGTDKRPVFEVDVLAPDAGEAEVFVEGPVDWYPAVPTLLKADDTRATFSVMFNRLGSKTPIGGNTFTVTVVADGTAVADTVTAD